MTGLLRLPERDFQRADVMAWLTGCPVRPAAGRTPGFYPSRWDSLTRKAGIVGGLEQWRDRLGRHAKQLREDAERWEQAEEISEGRASLMRAEAYPFPQRPVISGETGRGSQPPAWKLMERVFRLGVSAAGNLP